MLLYQRNVVFYLLLGLIGIAAANKEREKCRNYARHIATFSQGRSQLPPDVIGVWTSLRCEVIPGPKFILRKIVITKRQWSARFHHYSESGCVNPTFTISVSGRYNLKGESGRTKGAYVSSFDFTNMTLTPHRVHSLLGILETTERHCPGAGLPRLELDRNGQALSPEMKTYTLYKDAYKKRDCRHKLALHFYSFRLVKVITYYKQTHLFDELYFGEIPTHSVKKNFVPSSFQYALVRAVAPSCSVCRAIRSASANFPPVLSNERRVGTIKGDWVSKNCEVQSDMFLSRFLRFHSHPFQTERKWELNYFYFSDPNCQTISYIISASGNYSEGKPSSLIAGASNYAFTLKTLKITPLEKLIVTLLKSPEEGTCGDPLKWRVGEEQDVTATRGCSAFRLSLPSTDHDILKVSRRDNGKLELFTGQRPTDGSSLHEEKNRPRSFQSPLSMCHDLTHDIRPITTQRPTEKPSIEIGIHKFTIPAELLPTRSSGNEVEQVEIKSGQYDSSDNGSLRSCIPSNFVVAVAVILIQLICR